MRSQYIKSLMRSCERRSRSNTSIRWWFSDNQFPPRRIGGGGFADESTLSLDREPDVETLEDPPLEDEFFQQLGYA